MNPKFRSGVTNGAHATPGWQPIGKTASTTCLVRIGASRTSTNHVGMKFAIPASEFRKVPGNTWKKRLMSRPLRWVHSDGRARGRSI